MPLEQALMIALLSDGKKIKRRIQKMKKSKVISLRFIVEEIALIEKCSIRTGKSEKNK